MTGSRKELALVVPFYAALAILFTWPASRLLFSHVPAPGDGVDAFAGIYALTWGIHALANFPHHYFAANVFYPHAQSLAYGEHLFGLAVVLAPIQWTLANPVLTYNLAVIGSFVVAGTGACLLGHHVTGSLRCGFLAGLLYGFSAWRFGEIEHLGALSLAGLPWVFLIGHLYLETKQRRLIYLGAFFALAQATASTRSLFILLAASGVALGYSLYRQSRRRNVLFWRDRAHFLTATGLFLIGLSPFLKPYLDHFIEEGLAAAPAAAARATPLGASLMSLFPWDAGIRGVQSPGWVAIALIVLLATGLLRGRDEDEHRIYFYAFIGAFGVLLRAMFPVPLNALVSLAAAVLAALSFRRLERALHRFRVGSALASLVFVVAAVELHPATFRMVPAIPANGPPAEYLWLQETDPQSIVVELPAAPEEEAKTPVLARRELYSIYHWRRTIDGVTNRPPRLTRAIRGRLQSFPDDLAIAQLNALHVDYVLVHRDEVPAADRERLLREIGARRELALEREFGETAVYRLE